MSMTDANYGSDLNGYRAVVTGAADGIGAACARTLARLGIWTACVDRVSSEKTVGAIGAENGQAVDIPCDVSREEDVCGMFARVRREVGGLDFLVHCAGVIDERPLLDTRVEDFDRVININLRGTFLVGREAIRLMGAQGGRVVLISSDLGYLGRETFSAYVASKHGVLGLTRSWAKEFAPGILVNAICPGPIDTAMLSEANMTEDWRRRELDIPLGRFGAAQEIADMAVFLLSDSARFITGQGMNVNGGSVMP